jgi:hypothetical protein
LMLSSSQRSQHFMLGEGKISKVSPLPSRAA